MTREQEILVDCFLEELAEGYIPTPDSPERKAYEVWRAEEMGIEITGTWGWVWSDRLQRDVWTYLG